MLFIDPIAGVAIEPRGAGQEALAIWLEPIASEMRERAADQIGKLARNRYVVHNANVIAGTRIPTSAIWNFHSAGYSTEHIIREYPRLTAADVQAAIEFESTRHSAARPTGECGLAMLLLIDENVPVSVASIFERRGHDVR